jgi:membrane protease subunit HflK
MTRKKRSTPVVFQGLEAGLKMFRWVVAVLLLFYCFSGVERVAPESQGLLLRFGRLQGATRAEQIKQPGLLLAFPLPIDQVVQVPVKQEGEVEIDEVWHELTDVATTDEIDPVLEGYCLTGDQNIMQAKLVVKYKIVDPIAFEFSTYKDQGQDDREAIVRDVVLAALTQTVAGWSVDEVQNLQRTSPLGPDATESLAETVRARAQARLDALKGPDGVSGCGLEIRAVEFKEVHPPRHVIEDFRRVRTAETAMSTAKQDANLYEGQQIPEAKARANGMIQFAMAYKSRRIADAKAEAEQFQQIYKEYQKNPKLVRQRMYLETIRETLGNTENLHFVPPTWQVVLPGESQP